MAQNMLVENREFLKATYINSPILGGRCKFPQKFTLLKSMDLSLADRLCRWYSRLEQFVVIDAECTFVACF